MLSRFEKCLVLCSYIKRASCFSIDIYLLFFDCRIVFHIFSEYPVKTPIVFVEEFALQSFIFGMCTGFGYIPWLLHSLIVCFTDYL